MCDIVILVISLKVISIKEPFASLIKEGIKKIETRSWKTNYRGDIYIHASLSMVRVGMKDERMIKILELLSDYDMMYGKIICKAKLIDCIYMDEAFIEKIKKNEIEYCCGCYEVGRYAWVLDDIQVLDFPIVAKGKLGIWNYEGLDD